MATGKNFFTSHEAKKLVNTYGSSTLPVYINGGVPTGTTYSLGSTLNAGTASRIAYFSGANAVSAGSVTTDGGYLGNISYLSVNTAHQTGYRLYVNGKTKIASDSASGDGTGAFLELTSTNTSFGGFYRIINHTAASLPAGKNTCIMFGKDTNKAGQGYINYQYNGEDSDSNQLTFGFNNYDHLVRIYKTGNMSIGADNNSYKLYVNGTSYFANNITLNKTCYFGNNTSVTAGKPILAYDASNTGYGIWYYESSPDVMTFSASGNANSKTGADLSINGLGNGILSHLGNYIPHTGNTTGTVGSTTQPVYVNAGKITAISYTIAKSVPSDAVFTDHTYNFSGVSFTSGQSSTAEHNCNNIASNGHWYYTSNGPATSLGATTNDGALYTQAYSTSWVGQIAQDYRNGKLYVRAKSNGSWTSWLKVWCQGDSVTSAVWNDYAECRQSDSDEPGYVLVENGDDTLSKSTERLQPFAGISSDTWGFSEGETETAKTHIAVAGRVLAYTYRPRDEYKPGDCVCTAPGGTVDIMTREEVREWPDRIVGTVSCVPDYEVWGGGELADREPVQVDGRIWIKVR